MKKSVKLTMTILCAAVFLCSAVSAVLYYLACRQAFDANIFHFVDAPIVNAMTAMFIITPVICAIAGLCIRKRASFTAIPENTPLTFFGAFLSAILFAASAVMTVIEYRVALFTAANALTAVTALLAALSFVYFILFCGGKKTFTARIWLSFAPVAWAFCSVMKLYFENTRPINDPIKALMLLLCCAHLLFLCEDIRFYVGRQSVAISYFVTLAAAFASIAVAIPNLLLTLADTPSFDFSSIDSALYVAIGFFALARLEAMPRVLGEYSRPSFLKDGKHSADAKVKPEEKITESAEETDASSADEAKVEDSSEESDN